MSRKDRLQGYLRELKKSGTPKGVPAKGLSGKERELMSELMEEGLLDDSLRLLDEMDVDREWEKVLAKLDQGKVHRLPMRTLWKYAAIFIGLVSLGTALIWNLSPENLPISGNVITLDMGNGVRPILENKKQSIVLASGKVVAVKEGNTLRYDPGYAEEPLFNELHIPNGRMFTLILSDGTQVQLNSGTHIRYPVKFSKLGQREVSLSGEAYFKVTSDSERPFIVRSGEMATQVLGTEFNVSAYEDERSISTVLVEGSVSLSHVSDPGHKLLLTPGSKGSWNKGEKVLTMNRVDPQLYTSWLHGEIVFRATPFDEMLVKLERFYNVKITNHNKKLERMSIDARYNRGVESIETVMETLRLLTPFQYRVKLGSPDGIKEIIIE